MSVRVFPVGEDAFFLIISTALPGKGEFFVNFVAFSFILLLSETLLFTQIAANLLVFIFNGMIITIVFILAVFIVTPTVR